MSNSKCLPTKKGLGNQSNVSQRGSSAQCYQNKNGQGNSHLPLSLSVYVG